MTLDEIQAAADKAVSLDHTANAHLIAEFLIDHKRQADALENIVIQLDMIRDIYQHRR